MLRFFNLGNIQEFKIPAHITPTTFTADGYLKERVNRNCLRNPIYKPTYFLVPNIRQYYKTIHPNKLDKFQIDDQSKRQLTKRREKTNFITTDNILFHDLRYSVKNLSTIAAIIKKTFETILKA